MVLTAETAGVVSFLTISGNVAVFLAFVAHAGGFGLLLDAEARVEDVYWASYESVGRLRGCAEYFEVGEFLISGMLGGVLDPYSVEYGICWESEVVLYVPEANWRDVKCYWDKSCKDGEGSPEYGGLAFEDLTEDAFGVGAHPDG